MKDLGTRFVKLMVIVLAVQMFFACSKDDDNAEPDKPYVGAWESAVYDALDPLTGAPVKQKMEFTFTNSTFEDIISQGATENALSATAGIKGSIANPSEGKLQVEINELSLDGGNIYINKNTDKDLFDQAFGPTLGKMLHEEFEATYELEGDEMMLIIPIKMGDIETSDTLNLTKK